MKILFVCKHNRFRSKVAEAIFNKLNKNKKIEAESAGIMIDKLRNYIAENVIKVMKKKSYNVRGKSKQLTKEVLESIDLLIIVANNVDKGLFREFKGKIIKWEIPDADESEKEKITKIIRDIEVRVKNLIGELNN